MAVITPDPPAWQRTAAEHALLTRRRRAVLAAEPVEPEALLEDGFVSLGSILAAAAHSLAATA